MSKYGRPVDHSTVQDGSDIRMIDVVDTPAPLPSWAADDAAWLAKQFPTLSGFVQIHDGVQSCAFFKGSVGSPFDFTNPLKFRNPDGTNANGEPYQDP